MNSDLKSIGSDMGKSAKKAAQDAVKKIAHEPLEMLKTAGNQVGVVEDQNGNSQEPGVLDESLKSQDQTPSEEEVNRHDSARLAELEAEIAGYRKAREEKWEEIKQQQEAEMQSKDESEKVPFAMPLSKQSRRMMGGMKGHLQNLKQKSEIRMPPSG